MKIIMKILQSRSKIDVYSHWRRRKCSKLNFQPSLGKLVALHVSVTMQSGSVNLFTIAFRHSDNTDRCRATFLDQCGEASVVVADSILSVEEGSSREETSAEEAVLEEEALK